MKIYKRNTY